jgi:HAD superfamily hydrolase (TIGR01509 family)
MIRGAIFDADGTLLDSMPIWSGVGSGYLRSMGIEAREDLDERFKDMSLYQSALCLKEEYELPLSIEEIGAGINKMVDHLYAESVELKPGVMALLEELKNRGVKMCVATASEAYQISMALERCGAAHYFEKVLSCVDIGHGKDEPHIFYEAMNVLGTGKEDTFLFEDAVYSVRTAKAEGIKSIGIYEQTMPQQAELMELTEFYIKDYRELDDFWNYMDNV